MYWIHKNTNKKEALIKLQGKQISDDMKSLLQYRNIMEVKLKTLICNKRRYVYSICENTKYICLKFINIFIIY